MYMVKMHWSKIKINKMKCQNKNMKQKSYRRVFWFNVNREMKHLNNFIKTY